MPSHGSNNIKFAIPEKLRAHLLEYAREHPDQPLPSVRALKSEFGGGSTRILRIRRQIEVELDQREPDARRSRTPSRLERVAADLDRIRADLSALSDRGGWVPAHHPNVVPLHADRKHDVQHQLLTRLGEVKAALARQQAGGLDEQPAVEPLAAAIERVREGISALPRSGEIAELKAQIANLQDMQAALTQAVADLKQGLAPRPADRPDMSAAAPPDPRIDDVIATQRQLAASVDAASASITALTQGTAAKHHGLEAAADRLEECARNLAALIPEPADTPHVPVEQRVVEALLPHFRDLDLTGRVGAIEGKLDAIAMTLADHADQGDILALAEWVGSQASTASAQATRSIDALRRARDRAAARDREALAVLAAAVEALWRRRPPRTVRLHPDSVAAVAKAAAPRAKHKQAPRKKVAAQKQTGGKRRKESGTKRAP